MTRESEMEALSRLVSESLARHGFDRPLDYRRLRWSRWFRCESHHSLLSVPSKPGVFALAEEIMDLGASADSGLNNAHLGTAAPGDPAEPPAACQIVDGQEKSGVLRRMLGVTQFFEDDDMAFVLDRMLSRQNPMRARLQSGRYFVRFVVIEDQAQRRSICSALNQWIVSSTEKTTGIGAQSNSLEFSAAYGMANAPLMAEITSARVTTDSVVRTSAEIVADSFIVPLIAKAESESSELAQKFELEASNLHCPQPFPSGF